MSRQFRSLLFLVLAQATIGSRAQVVGGSLVGTVTDPAGAAVANAHTVIRNSETGAERLLITGPDGRYTAPSLAAGRYILTVTASSFASAQLSGINIAVGQTTQADVTLATGTVAQNVLVEEAPSSVDLSVQQTSGLIDSRQVKEAAAERSEL